MKKSIVKKVIALAMATSLCLGVSATNIFAQSNAVPTDNGEIMPLNIAITSTYNNLTLGTLGKLTCEGQTSVQRGYNAGVFVELQQYDGGWNTIKSWTNASASFAIVEEDYYVEKGYSYRLKLTHSAYNTNWTLVESFVKYSKIVSY